MIKVAVLACVVGAVLGFGGRAATAGEAQGADGGPRKIPVILDTDIGNDIDDTWAVIMLLRSPGLDVRMVTTTDGQAEYRARLLAKLLTIAGRTDVPIGLGVGKATGEEREAAWLGDFKLSEYKGTVHKDGVAKLIEAINGAKEPLTVIAIGPLQTLAMALEKDAGIAGKAHFVGMQGSVFRGYGGSAKPDAEFNVKVDVGAAQRVLGAPWKTAVITPLDTCGLPEVTVKGAEYQKLRESRDPLIEALLAGYAAWAGKPAAELRESTVLFDTVAVCLADPADRERLLEVRPLRIAVTDEGMTVVSPAGREMGVATAWKDVEAFRGVLMGRLLRNGGGGS